MPRGKKKVEKEVDEITPCRYYDKHGGALCILPKDHKGNHSNGTYEWSDAAGQPNAKEKVSDH